MNITQGTWGDYYEGAATPNQPTSGSCVTCLHNHTTCAQAHPSASQFVALYRLQQSVTLCA